MKLLLDTHIVLWFFGNTEKLSKETLRAIIEPLNEKFISIASAWELTIKISLGKLTFEGGINNFFTMINENGFELLPVKEDHIKRLETLPFLHHDPFDRLLIASAMADGMILVSADTNIKQYKISSLW